MDSASDQATEAKKASSGGDMAKKWFIRCNERCEDFPSFQLFVADWVLQHANFFKSNFRVGGNVAEISPSIAAKSFKYFPRLPVAVRHRIWKHAIPAGRLVRIFYTKIQYLSGTYSNDDLSQTTFTSNTPVPSMLHACSESREIASKVYKLCLGTDQSPATVYLDLSVDTLYFGSFARKDRIFDARTLVNTFAEEFF